MFRFSVLTRMVQNILKDILRLTVFRSISICLSVKDLRTITMDSLILNICHNIFLVETLIDYRFRARAVLNCFLKLTFSEIPELFSTQPCCSTFTLFIGTLLWELGNVWIKESGNRKQIHDNIHHYHVQLTFRITSGHSLRLRVAPNMLVHFFHGT